VDGPIDWASEWFNSIVWILAVTAAAAVGSALIGMLLMRTTAWGRQFRRLAMPYFRPTRDRRTWGPLLLILTVLLITITTVRMNVLFSYQSNGLYTALQELDADGFWFYIVLFLGMAAIWVVKELTRVYVQSVLSIRWRVWTNDRMVGDWLSGGAYHRGQFVKDRVDNPDQRIQEDVQSFVSLSLTLAFGAIGSLVSLVSFTLILWELSGPLNVFGVEVPRAMVFFAFLYVIVASVIAFRIGRPLIRLNFLNEQLTGSFRYALVRVRENSERIAFYRGEEVEGATLDRRFAAVIDNVWAILYRNLKFLGFNFVITQGAEIVPLVIQGPRFLAGSITLGDVTQTATAFGQVHDSLSFFRNAYDDFAGYRAVLNRLTGLLDANEEARDLPSIDLAEGEGLQVRAMTVRTPDGAPLVDDLELSLTAGDTLIIKGPSGSGKTTILRTMADLWPYAEGSVRRPLGGRSLFLSQQPYVPLGSLRTALAYPEPPEQVEDDSARAILQQVQLGHLVDQLDDDVDWSRRLSPGEQQRIGFARILVGRPDVVFLDEATSAVDEGIEHMLYQLIRAELPETIVVSVGHRSTLDSLHAGKLELAGGGGWTTGD